MINIEIDGKKLKVKQGDMVIEAADEAGIKIPRFCYHKKLSIAANCRMCLVEVANAPKPMPACATPVSDGMVVYTQSAKATEAQRSVMEFLLINHPLDCPVCDQGGECELQDLAMGYGSDVAKYTESKRVVADKNLGELVATDMTRCIHCTRCVRFGDEVAGFRELGATGRGESTEIGTYVEKNLASELSGNIIDLCPVGALTAKPSRFTARAWELTAYPSLAMHDCLGSNTELHVYNSKVNRVVPRENEQINEVWLSDRDRFSYAGLSEVRQQNCKIKLQGKWQEVSWDKALAYITEKLTTVLTQQGATNLGALASYNASVEEYYLLQKFMRGLGSNNVDHRLKQLDFSQDTDVSLAGGHALPAYPSLGLAINELENLSAGLLIGYDCIQEQPLLSIRFRKAYKRGAKLFALGPKVTEMDFITAAVRTRGGNIAYSLARVLKAGLELVEHPYTKEQLEFLAKVIPQEQDLEIAKQLLAAKKSSILLGEFALTHPEYSLLQKMTNMLATITNSAAGELSIGANSAGAWLAGCLPFRDIASKGTEKGLNVREMLQQQLSAYVLLNVQPKLDLNLIDSTSLHKAFVVAMSSHASEDLAEVADVILPIASYAETAGTYININGVKQTIKGVLPAVGEARPAWKVLRVMGNLMGVKGFSYMSTQDILAELDFALEQPLHRKLVEPTVHGHVSQTVANKDLILVPYTPLYLVDSVVRNAKVLHTQEYGVKINSSTAHKVGVTEDNLIKVEANVQTAIFRVDIDDSVADNVLLVPLGVAETAKLLSPYAKALVQVVK